MSDTLNLPWIFGKATHPDEAVEAMRQNMRRRLIALYTSVVDSVFLFELNKKAGLDLTNRTKMMAAFNVIWKKASMNVPSVEVKWGEWAVLEDIGEVSNFVDGDAGAGDDDENDDGVDLDALEDNGAGAGGLGLLD